MRRQRLLTRLVAGEHAVGSSFSVYFGDAEKPAAVMQVLSDSPDQVEWRVTEGPGSWTNLVMTLDPLHDETWTRQHRAHRGNELDNLGAAIRRRAR